MKKLVLSLVLAASLAIVPSAFALKAMTADSMKDTTGQAGVDIAVDNIIIYSGASTTIYRDTDGITGATNAAGVVISGTGGFTFVDGIVDGTSVATAAAGTDYVALMASTAGEGNTFHAAALTIDVTDTLTALSAGYSYNADLMTAGASLNIAGVQIGLPTVEIRKSGSVKTYGVEATAYNGAATYIEVEKTASSTAILGGTIEIAPH